MSIGIMEGGNEWTSVIFGIVILLVFDDGVARYVEQPYHYY